MHKLNNFNKTTTDFLLLQRIRERQQRQPILKRLALFFTFRSK